MKSKDTKELVYLGLAGIAIGVTITLLELYYNNYQLIATVGFNIGTFDQYLAAHPAWNFLSTNVYVRLYAVAAWAMLMFYPTRAEKKGSVWRHVVPALLLCGVFYALRFLVVIFPNTAAQAINIIATLVLIIPILRKFLIIARYLAIKNASLDENVKNADGFEQTEELIEFTNEDGEKVSVNLQYEFRYRGQKRIGYANFLNPFRGTITIGTPGSGKTYVSLEEFMRQFISRGYAAVIYDFKDPALSKLAYSYLCDYHLTTGKTSPKFGYVSFKDLNKTHRCNPMKGIATIEEANNFAELLMLALNKTMADKQGDFFNESAKSYTGVAVFVLGVLFDGKYQSLPHLLTMVGWKITELFPVYAMLSVFYPELKSTINTFMEAYEQGATEQLQGQVASARIGLARINNPLLCYVMTEDEEHPEQNISLDVNNPDDPIVFCIGNDPNKDIILGLANSVYLSRLAQSINKKGHPVLFGVDELPTVFVKGLNVLIGTARSNKVAVSLGFQDYTQLTQDYGQKVADVVINTCGNIISGSVKGDTARKLSESFGDKKVLKLSKSVNQEGDVNTTFSEARERKIPQDMIEKLSMGTFVGRVMDEFTQEIENKEFHGRFIIDSKHKKIRHKIPNLRNLNEREQKRAKTEAQMKVMQDVQTFINEAGIVAKKYEKLRTEWTKRVPQKAKDERPEDEAQPVCLERFVDTPDAPKEQQQFVVWLELAYLIVNDFEALAPVDDVLTSEEKFIALLENVYNEESSKINLVKEYRKKLGLTDLEKVQSYQAKMQEQETITDTEQADE
ncbi:conjugal transfer protein TraG [Bacteroidia bacterium]|nr:conjugal transfer protein TraG [Bacteroidia bacterium]